MNIIVPMAGRGSRLRPHTLTVPKPLVPVAGKPIVERLVEDIVRTAHDGVDNICFVIGDFGEAVEKELVAVAERLGAKGHIRHQDEPLGTAHAILCGQDFLDGPVVVAFADTLFRADFTIDPDADGVLFCQRIEDPSVSELPLDGDQVASLLAQLGHLHLLLAQDEDWNWKRTFSASALASDSDLIS